VASKTQTADKAPPPKPERPRYRMRRPGRYGGQTYDRDQVLELTGQPNDERLVRLGYIEAITPELTPVPCGECGARFLTAGALESHGRKRHRPVQDGPPAMEPRQPGESQFDYDQREAAFKQAWLDSEAQRESREQRALDRDAPINWENTAASRHEAGL
jgi:hypothetical protein